MSRAGLPVFDELFVVSDIHMGGEPGFQILKEGPRLGAFIRSLCDPAPQHTVGLVLNGDVIDSLAESKIDGYVATRNAEAIMDRIYDDPSFKPIWDALNAFVHTPNCRLAIVIGNHDIELALPGVMSSIRHRVAGDDAHARAALHFATHGEGFACTVGEARVFCTHGNEVDSFNIVDFSQLSQLGNALNAGRDVELAKWQPNAGTRIVIDVMNQIKRRYPFVDLLKPETKAAVGVLAVLAPELLGRSLWKKETVEIFKSLRTGSKRVSELLSADATDVAEVVQPELGAELLMESFLGDNLKRKLEEHESRQDSADDLLMEVEEALESGRPPAGFDAEEGKTLGVTDSVVRFFVDRLTGVPKPEALRVALLDWLEDDTTFDVTTEDSTFKDIIARVGPDVDFVITGHTHLYRALPFGAGGDRYYYNCGTWIRLLSFTEQLLNDSQAFEKLFTILESGDITALDDAKIPGPGRKQLPLVMDRCTAVRLHADGNKTHGELLHVGFSRGKAKVTTIANSQFTKP